MNEPAVRILTVCTGNICRSPVAERLLAARLGDRAEVTSAGTRAVVGAPIDPGMASLLDTAGEASGGFAARQLTATQIRDADLVLALTRAHRARILEEVPAALRRTFTLLEFARIVASPTCRAAPTARWGRWSRPPPATATWARSRTATMCPTPTGGTPLPSPSPTRSSTKRSP